MSQSFSITRTAIPGVRSGPRVHAGETGGDLGIVGRKSTESVLSPWSTYELLILCGFKWILLSFFLPETNTDFILLNRANRLRISIRNQNLRSDTEIKQGNLHFPSLLGGYLTTHFLITLRDPSVAFINVYTGLIYGIFFSH
ncbi:hypothetical protein N7447_009192 [Penicillium robsamsonii]|uniref:uncharacterized protein n=1 Tax=Penicillium robsamsonii TaxID=1792511 RepID=UPI00254768A7|nr:uncharacterized protein N7447_009192 [Penicillium robsamsonii]KAJ5816959.1 hypothetical protein N7447_009192 [Penicillium robsamsonii]